MKTGIRDELANGFFPSGIKPPQNLSYLPLSIHFILFDMFQLLCGEDDIKEMGIPMGPRKKLMSYLRNQKQEMVKYSIVKLFFIAFVDTNARAKKSLVGS